MYGLSHKIEDLSLRDFFKVLKAKGREEEAEEIKEQLIKIKSFTEEQLLKVRYKEVISLLQISIAVGGSLVNQQINPLEQRIGMLQAQGYSVVYNPDKVRAHGNNVQG